MKSSTLLTSRKLSDIIDKNRYKSQYFRKYDNHKRKLDEIRMDRKVHLNYDANRQQLIEQIKQAKTKSFIYRFNHQTKQIEKSNILLYCKLSSARKINVPDKAQNRSLSHSLVRSIDLHKKNIQTSRQNDRIYNKINTIQPTINNKKMKQCFNKMQKIKERVRRYTSVKDKVLLKSQRYFQTLKTSNVSEKHASKVTISIRQPRQFRKNISSYYNKDDIIRNKVNSSTDKAIFNLRNKTRKVPLIQRKQNLQTKYAFFTQPKRIAY